MKRLIVDRPDRQLFGRCQGFTKELSKDDFLFLLSFFLVLPCSFIAGFWFPLSFQLLISTSSRISDLSFQFLVVCLFLSFFLFPFPFPFPFPFHFPFLFPFPFLSPLMLVGWLIDWLTCSLRPCKLLLHFVLFSFLFLFLFLSFFLALRFFQISTFSKINSQ